MRAWIELRSHAKDQIIDLALARREPPVDRNGSCQIGVVIRERGSHIQKQQISVAANLVVGMIMQHTGVASSGNDWRIGKRAATTKEFMGKLSFHLVFADPRTCEFQDAAKPLRGDVDRLAEQIQFEI